jgi:ureidoacrylate peracid hydrolase
MANLKFDKEITALLVIDPYNDFISEGGKVWDRLKGVAEANQCVPHMAQVLDAARKAGLRVFYALHRRYRSGDYETWKYIAPIQKAAWSRKTFEYGTWGGEIRREFEPQPGDIVAQEHWCSSGFANTDLDCSSRNTASISSSSWDSSHTRVWRQLFVMPLSLVMRSRW